MPLFEFQCSACSHVFEELVRSGETPACPKCGQSQLEKLLSAPAAPQSSGASLPMAAAPSGHACRPGCCQHG